MNKFLRTLTILVLTLCFVLSTGVLAGCDDQPTPDDNPSKVEYTVTVTCTDSTVLSGVKVRILQSDGSLAQESALTDGKATFSLEKADYTVTLTGVADEYQFADGKLSATTTSCTVALTKKPDNNPSEPGPDDDKGYDYTVTVVYPDINDVFGNIVVEEGPASGVTVALYAGELQDDRGEALDELTPAATKTTDENGKATFKLEGELYTIVLSDYHKALQIAYPADKLVMTVSKEIPTYKVTFRDEFRFNYLPGASSEATLTFQLGTNTVPLTNDALAYNEGMGIFYSFTPAKSGTYTISATNNAVVTCDDVEKTLKGGNSVVVELEADKQYIFLCIAEGKPVTYTVTIEEGGEISEDVNHKYPWEGEGTIDSPFTANTLEGTFTDLYVDADQSFYVSYTPAQDETYTFSAVGEDLWLEVYNDYENLVSGKNYSLRLGDKTASGTLTLKAGVQYYFLVGTWSGQAGTVGFKAEKK